MRNDVPLMTSCSPGLQKKEKNCWSLSEVYFNDPREVPPEEILTEIYAPLD